MSIEVRCDQCDKTMRVKDSFAGTRGTCPFCKAAIDVPQVTVSAERVSKALSPPVTDMPISIQCPSCGKRLHGQNELAGKRVKCPKCGQVLVMPGARPPAISSFRPTPQSSFNRPDTAGAERNAEHGITVPPPSKRWPLYVGISLALVVLAIASAVFLERSGSNSDRAAHVQVVAVPQKLPASVVDPAPKDETLHAEIPNAVTSNSGAKATIKSSGPSKPDANQQSSGRNKVPKDNVKADTSPIENGLKELLAGGGGLGLLEKELVLPLYVSKEKNKPGISVNRFAGIVTANGGAYTKANISLATVEVREMIKHSAEAGIKPELQSAFVFGDEGGGGMQTYILGVHITDPKIGKTLLAELKNRFEFTVPLTLDFWIDENKNLYVDCFQARKSKGNPDPVRVEKGSEEGASKEFPVRIAWLDEPPNSIVFSVRGMLSSNSNQFPKIKYRKTNMLSGTLVAWRSELNVHDGGKEKTLSVKSGEDISLKDMAGTIEWKYDAWRYTVSLFVTAEGLRGKGNLRFAFFEPAHKDAKTQLQLSNWLECPLEIKEDLGSGVR